MTGDLTERTNEERAKELDAEIAALQVRRATLRDKIAALEKGPEEKPEQRSEEELRRFARRGS